MSLKISFIPFVIYVLLLSVIFLTIVSKTKAETQIDHITETIALTAQKYGVDVHTALYVSYMESHWDSTAIGDHGTSHGLWQIHLPAHKDISKQQAHDLEWSTEWAMKEMAKNSCRAWSTCPISYKGTSYQPRASQPLTGISLALVE